MPQLNYLLERIITNEKLSPAEKLDGVKQVFFLDHTYREQKHKICQFDFTQKYKRNIKSAKDERNISIELDSLALAVYHREIGLVKYLRKFPFDFPFAIFIAIYQERMKQTSEREYLTILRFLLSQDPIIEIEHVFILGGQEYTSWHISRDCSAKDTIDAFRCLQQLMLSVKDSALPFSAESKESKEPDEEPSEKIAVTYAKYKRELLHICKLDSLLAIDYLTERLRGMRRKKLSANEKAFKPIFLPIVSDFISQLIEWFTIKDALRPDVHAHLAERLITCCSSSPKTLAQFVLASAHEPKSTTEFLQQCGKRFLEQKPEKALKSLYNFTRQLIIQGTRAFKAPEYQFIIDALLSLWSNPGLMLQGSLAAQDKRNELLTDVIKGDKSLQALNVLIQKPGKILGLDHDEEQKKAVVAPPHLSLWIQPKLINESKTQGRRFSI